MFERVVRNRRGVSLIEALLAMGIMAVAVLGTVYVTEYQNRGIKNISSEVRLGEFLLENLNELKGKTRSTLGIAQGKCKTRTYDNGGNLLVTSAELDHGDANCNGSLNPRTGYVVVWKVFGPDTIDATFTPSRGMALPRYHDSIVRVEIIGWAASAAGLGQKMGTEIYLR